MKTALFAALALATLATAPALGQSNAPSTRAEMQQSVQARFAARDANHDGFMTADELGPNGAATVARLDADHDGKVSLAEAMAGMLGLFDRVDTNHDGTISPEERAAFEASMSQAPAAAPAPAQPAPHN